jgi:acyl-CoA reductase-like NAD-dependent aldehyde dehydrogenase
VPLATKDEMEAAVSSAAKAFQTWRHTPITSRQRIFFDLQRLVVKHTVCAAPLPCAHCAAHRLNQSVAGPRFVGRDCGVYCAGERQNRGRRAR